MADVGLSLNFAIGDITSPADNVPKFKGGSWKERARLNKAARFASATRLATPKEQPQSNNLERPVKRRRTDTPRTERPLRDRPAHLRDATYSNAPIGSREVISSLFTSNPEVTSVEEEKEQIEQEPVKPSNAPLPDGLDTFTSLGLSETTAAYLLTKMELKNPTSIQQTAVSQLTREDSDVFIQSQTGSGKTLAYLLPIVQRLATMAERQKYEQAEDTSISQAINRDSGLFAIVIAPTRELCKQISVVLEKLLGCAHYLVAGTVIGGEKKKSEKARLRKGLNILVATPGRLVDHLENTKNLDVSKVRYLVLDEGDRLMELGFEEDITKIVQSLDGKKRSRKIPGLPETRINILCSATLRSNVNKLGTISLKDAVLVKGDKSQSNEDESISAEDQFLAPAQLKQSFIVCPAKLRLVTLTALLKRTFARKGSVMKAIVFLSCADSVDFHHKVLTRPATEDTDNETGSPATDQQVPSTSIDPSLTDAAAPSPLLSAPNNPLTVYRLHGSLPQQTRTSIIKTFAKSNTPSLLLATDVASRGLDLPNLDLVIEYDPAFSKEDHLHRIGRTARVGRDGRATIFLLPGPEEGYIQILRESYRSSFSSSADAGITSNNVTSTSTTDILKKGFSPASGVIGTKSSGNDHETLATNLQLDVERWVLSEPRIKDLARNAFTSSIRAYATHTAVERKFFDIKELHLGHLAKAFGLRDAPGKINVPGLRQTSHSQAQSNSKPKSSSQSRKFNQETKSGSNRAVIGAGAPRRLLGQEGDIAEDSETKETKRKATQNLDNVDDPEVAAQKMREKIREQKRKMMMSGGADEFNIA